MNKNNDFNGFVDNSGGYFLKRGFVHDKIKFHFLTTFCSFTLYIN